MRMMFILITTIAFSGCVDKVVKPPKLETLRDRPPVEIKVREGCICGEYKDNAINAIVNFRSDIEFYKNQNATYNDKYTDNKK